MTPEKVNDLAALRGEMGLGNTLGALPVSFGGTGGAAAEEARSNLGIVPATNSQAGLAKPDGETITAGQNGIISTTFPVPKLTYRGTVTATTNSVTVTPPTGTKCTDFTLCVISYLATDSDAITAHKLFPIVVPVAIAADKGQYMDHGEMWMKVSVSDSEVSVFRTGSGSYGLNKDALYAAFI